MGTSNLHNSLWRQGTILPRELVQPGTLPSDLDPAAKLVIISHDCDIVHPSYDGEPYVEFFVAHPAAKSDNRKRKGKNPRRLQFRAVNNGLEQLYEINVHDKYRISRRLLEGNTPDSLCTIAKSESDMIARWAGKRYSRPAFPSEFDRCLSAMGKEKFERAIAKYGDDISGIFISFLSSTGELPTTEPYSIIVRVVAPLEALQDDSREQALVRFAAELNVLFAGCTGVQVEELKLESEAEFTLEDFKHSIVWDYEFISDEETEHSYLAGPVDKGT